MMLDEADNENRMSQEPLATPDDLRARLAMTPAAQGTVMRARQTIRDILKGEDSRLFIIVGPCSIHDLEAAREYAIRLHTLAEEVQDSMILVMRTYFEKPRTRLGWKGFANDPHLNGSFAINEGLHGAREFLLELAHMGLPAGTEMLNPMVLPYFSDLVCWTAVGARTAASQPHREVVSGLPMPVGFKNGTDGDINVAVNGLICAASPHRYVGMTSSGRSGVCRTKGNPDAHIVLRGGKRPNYDSASIAECGNRLKDEGLCSSIVVDCSHGNSLKDPMRQVHAMRHCCSQVADGNPFIVGFMIESHLRGGNQSLRAAASPAAYGVSITDACLGWEMTESLIRDCRDELCDILPRRCLRSRSPESRTAQAERKDRRSGCTTQSRSVHDLRRRLDVVDERLLWGLKDRLKIVEAICDEKINAGKALFDGDRERKVLRLARRTAEHIGLDVQAARNVMRSIVDESLRLQVQSSGCLSAKVRPGERSRRRFIIVGGRGRMGQCFAELFSQRGHAVSILEKDEPIRECEMRQADVVLIAVPMNLAIRTARELAPLVRNDALLCDVNSLKHEICEVMRQGSAGESLGMHPMFGPGITTCRRHKIVLCPLKTGPRTSWLRVELSQMGFELVECDPESHDRMMATIQVLTHFHTLVMGEAVKQCGLSLEETLRFASPVFRLKLALVGRLFTEERNLHSELHAKNPWAKEARQQVADVAAQLRESMTGDDVGYFNSRFDELQDYYREFADEAAPQLDNLLDALVRL